MNKEQLAAEITTLASVYYTGEPAISDFEFDLKVEELRRLDPDHPLLTTPGWGYKPESGTDFRHKYFMGSLEKVQFEDYEHMSHYYVAPKLDGMAASVVYKDGKLQHVLTRGDGTMGKIVDIDLDSAGIYQVLPATLANIEEIRGEFMMLPSVFEEISKEGEYTKPRSAVAGIVNSKDSPHKNKVIFVVYSIAAFNGKCELKFTASLFKLVNQFPNHVIHSTGHKTTTWFEEYYKNDEMPNCIINKNGVGELARLPIDGLVVTEDVEMIS